MNTKLGRPKSINPRNKRLEIRLNRDEETKLIKCCDELKLSKTNVLIKGLDLVYEKLQKK